MAKKLLTERFKELAGIKPLYEKNINEQGAGGSCYNVMYNRCSGPSQNTSQVHLTNAGASLQPGDTFTITNLANPNSGFAAGSQTDPLIAADDPVPVSCQGTGGFTPTVIGGCPAQPCTLSDFENAAGPFSGGYGPGWVQSFFNKFTNHPDGCRFLNTRLQIIQNKLQQLQSQNSNPNWQNKLQLKIQAIEAIIAQCCGMTEGSFPDLTGDGEVTYADILKGRGVELKENISPSHYKNFSSPINENISPSKMRKHDLRNVIREEIETVFEQLAATGSGTGSQGPAPDCYYCTSGSGNYQINSAPAQYNNNTNSYSFQMYGGSATACYTQGYTAAGNLNQSEIASFCVDPNQGGMCVVNQQAASSNVANPQLGDVGINQNFINNMAGKQSAFYQARHQALTNKLTQLRANDVMPNGGLQGFCQGSNPHWQAKLNNKNTYIQNCLNNPGSC